MALCHTREQAGQVQPRLAGWLEPRGLAFNEAKTRITHLCDGVDFLGFGIRRYPNGKPLTKPSKEALRRIRKRLAAEMRALRGSNADAVIPGSTRSSRVLRLLPDRGVQARLRRLGRLPVETGLEWARFTHPNKPKRWIIRQYFGTFNPARQDKWVFGGRETGFYLRKFAWTKIVRHTMVAGRASPDDPALTGYWASGGAAPGSRWTRRPGTCSAASAAGARYAGDCCCTPSIRRKDRRIGSSGTPSRARRSASTRSPA